ncbi:MAG: glucose dehydrogenase [Verrucomicrobia bacterium]|nr:MAG: glucose dehydrogenase [Verrucomicrobiota bacterium]
MKLHRNCSLFYLCLILLAAAISAQATPTIWIGPNTSFVNVAGSDPTQAVNQDRMTAHVWITRAATQGIYNAEQEGGFTHFLSPRDTEWADGTTANYSTLSYTDWNTWAKNIHGGPPGTVGVQAVVHLKSDDIYLNIQFTSWGGSAGGFSYVRATPTPSDVPPTVFITSPTNGATFTAPAVVNITATAADSDGTVTNVSFFDGATPLGGTNNTPYTVTATLAAGNHALTAVATDNAGISTASSNINVTVSTPPPLSVTITNPPDPSTNGNTDSVLIGATASGGGGTITNVQFFNGNVLIKSLTVAPYVFTTQPFQFTLGTNTLTAVALDNVGESATSAPVHEIIARYTPQLTNGPIPLILVTIATNMSAPLYGISPPGDTHRLFVLEQNGLMRIIQDGTLLPDIALNISNRVSPPLNAANANDERGLLGLAFHPGFNDPSNAGYQTLYTYNSEMIPTNTLPTYPCPAGATNNYRNVLNEWKISSTNANVVDPSSRREVISFGKNASNHNGGTCTFGPDGYLYLALGDGGNANDVGPSHLVPTGNAQSLTTPLGKMLRFDPLNPALNPSSPDPVSTNGQYRIPTTNPFQSTNQIPEIYALGLRNPYRFAFDSLTGDLIEADVGQNNIEEINRIVIGHNYGWAVKEGDFLFNMTNGPAGPGGTIGAPPGYFSPTNPPGLTDPISGPMGILEYDHNNGISITGGFVYRGSAMPELYGQYIFGDLALIASPIRIDGRIFRADLQQGLITLFNLPQFGTNVLPHSATAHGFGQDASGELYAMTTYTPPNGNGGVVYKLATLRLTPKLSGSSLDLTWPITGARLQTQTNSLSPTWFDVLNSAATNHVIVPVDPANVDVFYRLALP